LTASASPPSLASQVSGVVLSLDRLTKRFGSIAAVDELSLDVRAGEVLGLLGPNGAGKSTAVGMVLGLVKPTSGGIDYHGLQLAQIGAIIENPAFYPFMSGRDNLRALALASGSLDDARIGALLAFVGLADAGDKKVGAYSLGMKQRLGIASTLVADPRLVILDEPTNGLDPAGQEEIRAILPRLAAEGRAVIVASHLLHEVVQTCSRVAIIQNGKLRRTGTMEELLRRDPRLEIKVPRPQEALAIVSGLDCVKSAEVSDGLLIVGAEPGDAPAVSRALGEHGLYVESLVPKTASLEEVFFEVTGHRHEGSGS